MFKPFQLGKIYSQNFICFKGVHDTLRLIRTAKGGLKIHTVWDDQLGLPEMVNITEAKIHDSKGLEQNIYPKNTIIVEDRGYFDFSLMLGRIRCQNTFVTRIKSNTLYQSLEERDLPDEKDHDILKDEIIVLTSKKAMKQNLQIKIFLGTSENAVKSQIYVALICVFYWS